MGVHFVQSTEKDGRPVYTVQPIDGHGPLRTLHRDPCCDLSESEEVEPDRPTPQQPIARHSPPQHLVETSDSEDDLKVCSTQPSVIPEESLVQVFDIPMPQHPSVTRVEPLRPQLQGVATADETLPVEPVEMPPVVPEAEEPLDMNSEPTEMAIPPPDVTDATESDLLN